MDAWLQSLGSPLLALVAVSCFMVAAYGVGAIIVRPSTWTEPVDAALVSVVCGMDVLGLAGVLLGLPGLLRGGMSLQLLVITAGVTCIAVAAAVVRKGRAWREVRPAILPWIVFGSLAALTLGPSLCHPTGWDELVYHLVLPRRWLHDGRPLVYLDLPYSAFPSLGEFMFWLLGPIEALISPRLLTWTWGMLAFTALFRLLRKRLTTMETVALTLAFCLARTVLMILSNTYVELLIVANLAAMLLALCALRPRRHAASMTRHAVVLGILSGSAAATKLTGGVIVFVPVLWHLLTTGWNTRRKCIVGLALPVAVAMGFAFPFYLRPWLATGNPCYPYFAQYFSSSEAAGAVSRFHHAIGSVKFGLTSIPAFTSAPFLLANQHRVYDGAFGWQLLLLLALMCVGIARSVRRNARLPLLFLPLASLGLYVAWFVTSQQARFLVPALFTVVLSAGVGIRALQPRLRRLATVAILTSTLCSVPLERSGYYYYSWLCVAGRLGLADYVHTATDEAYLPAVDAIAGRTPADAKLMMIFEHRSLYVPRDCVIGTPYFQQRFFTSPEQFATGAALLKVLLDNGITHLWMAHAKAGPDLLPEYVGKTEPFARSVAWLIEHGQLRLLWRSPDYVVCTIPSVRRPLSSASDRARVQ